VRQKPERRLRFRQNHVLVTSMVAIVMAMATTAHLISHATSERPSRRAGLLPNYLQGLPL
jgi:hypothetical protein